MLSAGVSPAYAARSSTRRAQSTAAPNAWRTRTSSNGGAVVVNPTYDSDSDGTARSCGPKTLSYWIHDASYEGMPA
jgi:hypothetical protein